MKANFAAALDVVESSDRVGSLSELGSAVARSLGFQWFHYYCSVTGHDVTNGPSGWHDRYQSANYIRQDPLRKKTQLIRQAVVWQQGETGLKQDDETAVFMSDSANHGVASGVNIPVFGGFGREAFLCFSDDRRRIDDPDQYICPIIYVIGARLDTLLFFDTSPSSPDVDLTSQERLCLGWVSRGKTMSEAAIILGIQRRTVEFHLTNARKKLRAATVSHAVAEAIRQNLIA